MLNKNYNFFVCLFSYVFYIVLITFMVLRYYDYDFGKVIYTGDLRIHSFLPAENTDTLYNFRLMFETTPFVSMYPILSVLKLFNVEYIYFFILFLIPILGFFSMDFVLRKYLPRNFYIKSINLKIIISTTLSFVYVMNPSYFNRIGHWNINYLYIFIPLFFFLCDEFLKKKTKINRLLIISPIIFFGISSPHALVGFTSIMLLLIIINFKKNKSYVFKSLAIMAVHFYAISHNFLAMALKETLILRTSWEGETDRNILSFLSKNSSIVSALSGTNYYYDLLIIPPTNIGSGFIVFLLILVLIIKLKKFTAEDTKFVSFILIFFLINLGYNSSSFWYNNFFLKMNIINELLWIVKDSNIFYNFFIFLLIAYLVKKISNISRAYVLIIILLLLFINIYQISFSKNDEYKKFFRPIKIPEEYLLASNFLFKENKRTLWIPNEVYVKNYFAPDVTYFPNPNLWLTQNPEITVGNNLYREFIEIIQTEVVQKNCQNKYLISWLVKSNDLYIVLDENSVSEKTIFFKECLSNKMFFQKVYSTKSINIYKSNLNLINNDNLIEFKGDREQLNIYLQYNPLSNIHIEETSFDTPKILTEEESNLQKVLAPFNHRISYNNQYLVSSVNYISSMVKKGSVEKLTGVEYKNNYIFKNYIMIQLLVNSVFILLFLFIYINDFVKNGHNKL